MTAAELNAAGRLYSEDGMVTFQWTRDGHPDGYCCVEILSTDRREDGEVIGAKMVYRRVNIHDPNAEIREMLGSPFRVSREVLERNGQLVGVTRLA